MNGNRTSGVRAESRGRKSDRRHVDVPLQPGKKERRLRVERRLPVLDETTVSFAEWVKCMTNFIAARGKRPEANPLAHKSKPKK